MPPQPDGHDLSAERLRAAFDSSRGLTVGLEEEVMLLDHASLDLAPKTAEALARVEGDQRFKAELPASQLEILTEPAGGVTEAVAALAKGRRDLADAVRDLVRPAVAGVHPFAAPEGELSSLQRYRRTRAEYGRVASRQLVAALQVHVAVGGAERSLAVYNALRPYLPEIAALAANAPFYAGEDSGMASVRPKIAELLPRQGVPPAFGSWDEFAAELRWGAAAGTVTEPRLWWWELRLHPAFGTLEVRVPDAQTTLADAAGVAAFVHSLVVWLAERHDRGEALEAAPTWRIEENRWSAARHGVEGEMADLGSGEREPTRGRLRRLLAELQPVGERLGCAPLLAGVADLIEVNGAIRQRDFAARDGVHGLTARLADQFLVGADPAGPVLREDHQG